MTNWKPIPAVITESKETIDLAYGAALNIPTRLLQNPTFKEYTTLWIVYDNLSYQLAAIQSELHDLSAELFYEDGLSDEDRIKKEQKFDEYKLKLDAISAEIDPIIPKLKDILGTLPEDDEKLFATTYMRVSF